MGKIGILVASSYDHIYGFLVPLNGIELFWTLVSKGNDAKEFSWRDSC